MLVKRLVRWRIRMMDEDGGGRRRMGELGMESDDVCLLHVQLVND